MPENTDFDNLTASHENGVLTINVKKHPDQTPELKKIPIQ